MRSFIAILLFCFPIFSFAGGQFNSVNENQIDTLISQMSLEEKVNMLGGENEFDTVALPRLGITSIRMTDGPLGVRNGQQTAFPAGIAMGASFDPILTGTVSAAIADEARAIGRNMVLGPCVNISRNPFGGRNFESFGEDPYLTSQLAVSYIHGVQGQNVLASVKHFALNDQEFERMSINVNADLRTMFEIHFPAFKAAVDAGSWTVMASYNKLNGHWASENDFLLNKVLKGMWGFQGFVVSDWGATHSTEDAANAGLDLEMPYGDYFDVKLVEAVKNGSVKESLIDDKVRRILRAMYAVGIMNPDGVKAPPPPLGPESTEHRQLALKAAQESIVLLKNQDGILPLKNLKSIAVLGPSAAVARTGGGGSSQVDPMYSITPLQGLKDRLGKDVQLNFAMGAALPGETPIIPSVNLHPTKNSRVTGLKAEYFNNKDLSGSPIITRVDADVNFNFYSLNDPRLQQNFSVRWTGFITASESGSYKISTWSDDGVRMYFGDDMVIDNWTDHGESRDSFEVKLVAGQSYPVRLEYYQGEGSATISLGWDLPSDQTLARAVDAAKKSEVALLFVGLSSDLESEGIDRETFELPTQEVALIQAVAAANPNTIVVMNSGNPVPMGTWINQVRGVVQVWYGGQEGGHAIADVLTGVVNPSGKLPVTFLKRWEDSPAYGNYPGVDGQVNYAEGILVGYRHFDAKNIVPQFPFGYGLSYTQFAIHDLNVAVVDSSSASPQVQVQYQVTNTGAVAGAEVAQVYVSEQAPILMRPPQELKSFQKVFLAPGETKSITATLDASAFAYFEAESMQWKVNPGVFQIRVGSSSRNLPLRQNISLK